MNLESWKETLKTRAKLRVDFDSHFFLRSSQRSISPLEVQKHLEAPDCLEGVDEYKKEGYRAVFGTSSKFQLVIGLQILEKGLYIKTAFRRFRKWQPKKPKI